MAFWSFCFLGHLHGGPWSPGSACLEKRGPEGRGRVTSPTLGQGRGHLMLRSRGVRGDRGPSWSRLSLSDPDTGYKMCRIAIFLNQLGPQVLHNRPAVGRSGEHVGRVPSAFPQARSPRQRWRLKLQPPLASTLPSPPQPSGDLERFKGTIIPKESYCFANPRTACWSRFGSSFNNGKLMRGPLSLSEGPGLIAAPGRVARLGQQSQPPSRVHRGARLRPRGPAGSPGERPFPGFPDRERWVRVGPPATGENSLFQELCLRLFQQTGRASLQSRPFFQSGSNRTRVC